jgi:hypothetical protein
MRVWTPCEHLKWLKCGMTVVGHMRSHLVEDGSIRVRRLREKKIFKFEKISQGGGEKNRA